MSITTNVPTFKVGTLAFYDSLFAGLVPCKVIAIHADSIDVVITATRGRAFTQGETFTSTHTFIVPRVAVRRLRSMSGPRIGCYRWVR